MKSMLFGFLMMGVFASAKVSVTIDKAPAWGPSVKKERYYYLPDIETYYDLDSSEYIYLHNGYWTRAKKLPAVYRGYNLQTGRTVVIRNYYGNAPYVHYSTHRVKYVRGPKYYHYRPTYRANGR